MDEETRAMLCASLKCCKRNIGAGLKKSEKVIIGLSVLAGFYYLRKKKAELKTDTEP